jgi:hypothetical protein
MIQKQRHKNKYSKTIANISKSSSSIGVDRSVKGVPSLAHFSTNTLNIIFPRILFVPSIIKFVQL